MAFVTGLFLIDAPASALNNLGNVPGRLFDNVVGVKVIRTREGTYPYVSAQAFRYWLRTTLEQTEPDWKAAPIWREQKVAYTDANPIRYWDDDLFGYMRAPSTKKEAVEQRGADKSRSSETPTSDTITRASPFRVSTLVSIAPVNIVEDWESMSRHDGDPVPYSSQFYRATLKGLFSLDLHACGTFWYRQKTGFRNLDDSRIEEAKKVGLEELEDVSAYRLTLEERLKRITTLFKGMARLEGGAKQALHYTDVSPALVVLAVTRGGNHPFGRIIGANSRGLPELKLEALNEALTVFSDDILSDVYVGWVRGYLDEERARLEEFVRQAENNRIKISHPREAFSALIETLKKPENAQWLD
ncbi:MAG: type I-B CRISPR-associated protein Cas7/Cst2/DevR [Methanothrix sp.]|jgi:CRISPR-associated protein Cst2|nr:type I-B CRISPR-associated protein Cas7/Cst2/DevR [Methanothrix sp.]